MKVSNNLPPLWQQSKKKNPDDVDTFSSSILSSSNRMPPNKPITCSTVSAWKDASSTRSNVDFLYSNKMEKTLFESNDAWTSRNVLSTRTIDSTSNGNGTNAKKTTRPTIVDPIKPTNFDPPTAPAIADGTDAVDDDADADAADRSNQSNRTKISKTANIASTATLISVPTARGNNSTIALTTAPNDYSSSNTASSKVGNGGNSGDAADRSNQSNRTTISKTADITSTATLISVPTAGGNNSTIALTTAPNDYNSSNTASNNAGNGGNSGTSNGGTSVSLASAANSNEKGASSNTNTASSNASSNDDEKNSTDDPLDDEKQHDDDDADDDADKENTNGGAKSHAPAPSPPSESFDVVTSVFVFNPHPMEVYAGMDDAINSTFDLVFNLDCLFEDGHHRTILKPEPVKLLRRELIHLLADQNIGDDDDHRRRFDIVATVCQDIDLSAWNGRSNFLLRTPGSVTQALRVAKREKYKTFYVLVSTHHLFLLDHKNSSAPMEIASWDPTAFAPFLHRSHSELNRRPTSFVKDVIPAKSDIQQLTDVLLASLNLQQAEKIKATNDLALPPSRTDFDVTTTPPDVLARHNLYTKNGYYIRKSDLQPFMYRDTIMANAHNLEADEDYNGEDPFTNTDRCDAFGYQYFFAGNRYLFLPYGRHIDLIDKSTKQFKYNFPKL